MTAPDYRAILAQGNEYLPDAQALRELYFLGKAQSLSLPSVFSPSLQYQSRALLLPSTERVKYGKSAGDSGLQSRLGDNVGNNLGDNVNADHFGNRKPSREVQYGVNFGYLM